MKSEECRMEGLHRFWILKAQCFRTNCYLRKNLILIRKLTYNYNLKPMKTNSFLIKSGVVIALFFIFTIHLDAQQNYKLADYVNPDFRYHSLDFTLNLNTSGNLAHYESDNSTFFNNNYSNFNGNFNVAYYQIKNTLRYQGTQSISLYAHGSWNNSFIDSHLFPTNNYTSTIKQQNVHTQLNYTSSNRFYNTRKQFLEIIPEMSLNFQSDRNTYEQTPMYYPFNTQNLRKDNTLNFGLSVMVGRGRIENVENARLALYILNELQKRGDIKKHLSNAQVDQLARFITQLRNKRFFDSRLRNIAEITAMDSLLKTIGIREHAGAGYFMTLNDEWNYANGPVRQSGHRFAFGVTPEYSYDLLKDTQDNIISSGDPVTRTLSTDKTYFAALDFVAYYYLEKPVNLTWQHSTKVSLGYQLKKQVYKSITDLNYENTINNPNLRVSLEKIYGYYPNSRTGLALDLKLGGLYEMQRQKESDSKNHDLTLYASVALSGNYYFSPRLRLYLNVGASDVYQHFDNHTGTSEHAVGYQNSWSPGINMSLIYSIF